MGIAPGKSKEKQQHEIDAAIGPAVGTRFPKPASSFSGQPRTKSKKKNPAHYEMITRNFVNDLLCTQPKVGRKNKLYILPGNDKLRSYLTEMDVPLDAQPALITLFSQAIELAVAERPLLSIEALNVAAAENNLTKEELRQAISDFKKAAKKALRHVEAKPRPDWIEARKRGETPPEFISLAFARELAGGAMHKGLFGRFKDLRRDVYAYHRHHELPQWLSAIPTKKEWNDRQVSEGKVKPIRPPAPRTDEQRAYERGRRQIDRARQRQANSV